MDHRHTEQVVYRLFVEYICDVCLLSGLMHGYSGATGGIWGSPAEPSATSEELRKNVQRLLEKHASGVMGRDLRRLYKEVSALPPFMWILVYDCKCTWCAKSAFIPLRKSKSCYCTKIGAMGHAPIP